MSREGRREGLVLCHPDSGATAPTCPTSRLSARSYVWLRELSIQKTLAVSWSCIEFVLPGCSSSGKPRGAPSITLDAAELQGQMLKAMDSATSYRKKMISDAYGTHFEQDVEVACPGRSHIRIARNANVTLDTYFIDGSLYFIHAGQWTSNPQTWTVAPGCPGSTPELYGYTNEQMPDLISSRDHLRLVQLPQAKVGVKFAKRGTDTVDGGPCQIWEAAVTDDRNRPATIQLCIGTTDNLPRHFVQSAAGDRTEIRFADWNSQSITITAPSGAATETSY
jgi:hypothetical protein